MQNAKGQCLCAAVSFEAQGIETAHHACHCSMCRRWAGGPVFAAHVQSVEFKGEDALGIYESSQWAERGFCKKCGSNLFYRLKEGPVYLMSVGAFEEATAFKLAAEIYVDHQPSGYQFKGDLPRMTEEEFLKQFGDQ